MSILAYEMEVAGDKKHGTTKAKVLFDSGASVSMVTKEMAEKLSPLFDMIQKEKLITAGEDIYADKIAIAGFKLSDKCVVTHGFRVVDKLPQYDMIIGTDIMQNKKIKLDFKNDKIDTSECQDDIVI